MWLIQNPFNFRQVLGATGYCSQLAKLTSKSRTGSKAAIIYIQFDAQRGTRDGIKGNRVQVEQKITHGRNIEAIMRSHVVN